MSLNLELIESLLAERDQVEAEMASEAVLKDQNKARKAGRRLAELNRIAKAYQAYESAKGDVEAAEELAAEDDSFAQELPALRQLEQSSYEDLKKVLAPRDPDDARDILMEIKAGAGGDESALFAGDLMRMYQRYCEAKGWVFAALSVTESDLGGVKDAQISIKAKGNPTPEEGVWAHLKYEGGVHRVQRVPVTESSGRIHTSAAGVMVFPEVEEDDEIELDMHDVKVDVFRSSGPGGQSVNTTDSAVRMTHIPTGIVVSMQDQKSQIQNREAALRVLKARIKAEEEAKKQQEAAQARHSQVRTVDRSERIRTYNFPENRIADHRTGYKAYNLDQVLEGGLQEVIDSAIRMDEEARLSDL